MEISEILEAFRPSDGIYKRKYVDAAVRSKEEITPHLIDILERVLSNPASYVENDFFDHMYAIILLGYFREDRAHETIVNVFSMPGDMPRRIFGDLVTEDLPVVLFRTCHGSLEKIRSLALNKDAYDYCRSSALKAMVYAVLDGMVSREEILDFFGSLFTGSEAEPISSFWSFLANYVCDLYPEELMPVIEKAYQDELIELIFVRPEDFERILQSGKENTLKRTREEFRRRMHENVHDYISWWACFRSEQQMKDAFVSALRPPTKKKLRRKKRRKKKKMAKASRRRNRRR